MTWLIKLRHPTSCLVAVLTGLVLEANAAENPVSSEEKLRQFMTQVQPKPTTDQVGSQAVRDAATAAPARLQERTELLKTGETALVNLQPDAALRAFERAALILHAADTEMALVRAYMQGGEYRRALAFGAHTAGAHLDVVGGSALYAWLLHVGGQATIAQRLLTDAQARLPGNPLVEIVQQQLLLGAPQARGSLLALPTRLAPYGESRGLPSTARAIGTGLLLHSGKQALVPLQLLSDLPLSGGLWLRNGLGHLTKARVTKRITQIGVALLQLETALATPDDLWTAPSAAFPGSVGYAVGYAAAADATPAWPVLRTGFLGGVQVDDRSGQTERLLGIDMPKGLTGGPVFNAGGHLVGLALPGKAGTPYQLILTSQLPSDLKQSLWPLPPPRAEQRASVDRIYESSLRACLQLIAVKPLRIKSGSTRPD